MRPLIWQERRAVLSALSGGGELPARPGELYDHDDELTAGGVFVSLSVDAALAVERIRSALAKGASLVLHELLSLPEDLSSHPSLRFVPFLRSKRSALSLSYYPEVSSMHTLGITGTNGKSTSAFFASQLFSALGWHGAHLGTIGYGLNRSFLGASRLTTPSLISLARLSSRLYAHGARFLSMEVSSQALAQGRVAHFPIRGGLFTNLSRDHLDYHHTMAEYALSKARLFEFPTLERGVFGVGHFRMNDVYRRFSERLGVAVARFGAGGAFRISGVRAEREGFRFVFEHPMGADEARVGFLGRHNLENLLGVMAYASLLGIAPSQMLPALPSIVTPVGRLERFSLSSGATAIVDYAHTPDALNRAISSLKEHGASRVITLFGCGGNRDSGKRPMMGAVAESLSDEVILTSDNPRFEDPLQIIAEIQSGMRCPALVEPDRERAILQALSLAREGDFVLIAGKGHEQTQEAGGVSRPFSDQAVVLSWR